MYFKPLDLTTAHRPSLLPHESLHFVTDAVGLYHGRHKLPDHQNGHAYLTSHRICYVDAEDPRARSLAVDLKDVQWVDFQAAFLRSSPKVILHPKKVKGDDRKAATGTGADASSGAVSATRPAPVVLDATWICSICTSVNPVPSNFDPETAGAASEDAIPPCLACGIRPTLATLLKACIAARTGGGASAAGASKPASSSSPSSSTISCPRCTFANHASLLTCEMCGAPIRSLNDTPPTTYAYAYANPHTHTLINTQITDPLKLSFRAGGDRPFHDRLKHALVQRKWLLANAPPVPAPSPRVSGDLTTATVIDGTGSPKPSPRAVGGIAGLERRGLEARRTNEAVIGSAFEDLEALMASAKQIVALAESFARTAGTDSSGAAGGGSTATTREASTVLAQLGSMVTTRDMLGAGAGGGGSAETLYLTELARNLAEWLTTSSPGGTGTSILNREGGIMTLVDVWSLFNRARNGVELVSPSDFRKAAELWGKLRLPVRLRRFRSGVYAVTTAGWSEEGTVRAVREWLDELRCVPPEVSVLGVDDGREGIGAAAVKWDWRRYGRGVTAQEAAARFGWSVGVAVEELEMAEEKGVLCREEGIQGCKFWRNYLVHDGDEDDSAESGRERGVRIDLGLLTV